MGDVHYMISEAAKQVAVEPHVLRYWEEELSLSIGRTEMGHRYYTKEDIQLFICIKKLKETGMPLRDLKALIPDMIHTKNRLKMRQMAVLVPPAKAEETKHIPCVNEVQKSTEALEPTLSDTTDLPIKQLFETVLTSNNEILTKAIVQSMELLLDIKERQEEERFHNLDMLIRQQQEHRRQISRSSFFRHIPRFSME